MHATTIRHYSHGHHMPDLSGLADPACTTAGLIKIMVQDKDEVLRQRVVPVSIKTTTMEPKAENYPAPAVRPVTPPYFAAKA